MADLRVLAQEGVLDVTVTGIDDKAAVGLVLDLIEALKVSGSKDKVSYAAVAPAVAYAVGNAIGGIPGRAVTREDAVGWGTGPEKSEPDPVCPHGEPIYEPCAKCDDEKSPGPSLLDQLDQLSKAAAEVSQVPTALASALSRAASVAKGDKKPAVWGVDKWKLLVDCPECAAVYDWVIKSPKLPHICRNCGTALYVKEIRDYKGGAPYVGPVYEAAKPFGGKS